MTSKKSKFKVENRFGIPTKAGPIIYPICHSCNQWLMQGDEVVLCNTYMAHIRCPDE